MLQAGENILFCCVRFIATQGHFKPLPVSSFPTNTRFPMNNRFKKLIPWLADAVPECLVILGGAACITGLWYLCFVVRPF